LENTEENIVRESPGARFGGAIAGSCQSLLWC
jgi:hypothetical protein